MLHKDSPHLFQVDIYAFFFVLSDLRVTLLNMNNVDVWGSIVVGTNTI